MLTYGLLLRYISLSFLQLTTSHQHQRLVSIGFIHTLFKAHLFQDLKYNNVYDEQSTV